MWAVATSNSASEPVSSPPNPRSHLKVKFATLVEKVMGEEEEAGEKEETKEKEAEVSPEERREDPTPSPSNHEDYGDLPDGSCFRRGKSVAALSSPHPANSNSRAAVLRSAEYMGSFAVAGADQASRAEYIRNQLQQMRGSPRTKPVLLVISLAGIKVCSIDGKSVHMAHALRRISYATCDPEHLQFSFLAREPRGHLSLQYCHSFLAQSSQQAEELNSIVGNAFRMAYASQLHRRPAPHPPSTSSSSNSSVCSSSSTPPPPPPPPLPPPSPDAVIASALPPPRPLHPHKTALPSHLQSTHPPEKRRNQLNQDKHGGLEAQQSVNDNNNNSNNNQQQQLSLHSSSNHRRISGEVGRVVGWAKQRPQPVSPSTEMNVRISGSQTLEPQSSLGSGPIKPNSIPGLGTKSDPPRRVLGLSEGITEPDKENGLHLGTIESSPSSDESNSPTEMNSYKRMTEKPPLIKRLAMMGVGSGFSPRGDESCPLVRQTTSPTPPACQSTPAGNSESPTKMQQVHSPQDMSQFRAQMKHRPLSGGYVNEAATSTDGDNTGSGTSTRVGQAKVLADSKQITTTKHIDTDPKRLLQEPSPPCDDLKSKRISHINSSSSTVSGTATPASTSTTASPIRNTGLTGGSTQQNEPTLRLTSQAVGGGANFIGCCTPPPLPERSDSLNDRSAEEGELRAAPWFQAGIPREITLEVLGQEPVGAFMVRESTSKPGCYALSLRVPRDFQQSGIAHYLIMRTNKGYKIKADGIELDEDGLKPASHFILFSSGAIMRGFTKEFSTLTSLITHHSVMPELLPCPLSLSRYNPSFINSDSSRDFADIDSDPDYNTLADFRKMMADLNV